MWCAKWRIKLNPVKTEVIIFSRSILARKTELNLKLYGETLKIYPQVNFLGITFDSQLNFKKHFEDILDRCNTRYHRLRLLVNKKWGPSPATLIQIYKQCVRRIFKYGSLSTITIFLLTGLRIYTVEYKAQGPTLCPTEGRALRGPRALYSHV